MFANAIEPYRPTYVHHDNYNRAFGSKLGERALEGQACISRESCGTCYVEMQRYDSMVFPERAEDTLVARVTRVLLSFNLVYYDGTQ